MWEVGSGIRDVTVGCGRCTSASAKSSASYLPLTSVDFRYLSTASVNSCHSQHRTAEYQQQKGRPLRTGQ
jgi:hypothetical protein